MTCSQARMITGRMNMRRGNGKKNPLMGILLLSILLLTLCACSSSAWKTSEHNSTEAAMESSAPEESINPTEMRKSEFPFDGFEKLICQEYDENNILGLSAIYVGEHDYVYCFVCNEIWKDFTERNSDISIRGVDKEQRRITISGYEIEESEHYFWVRIYAEDIEKVKGFSIDDIYVGYSVLGLENPKLTIFDLMYLKQKIQLFEDGRWGEIIDYDGGPIHDAASSGFATLPPVEETVPFDISADAVIYKYSTDNLLGLSAVIVNASSEVIYVFDLRIDLLGFSKEEGFSAYGINPDGKSFLINDHSIARDDHRQYMLLKCDKEYEIDGFYLANMISDHQYEAKKNDLPVVREFEYSFSKKTIPMTVTISSQSYDANKKIWNDIEQNEDVLQLDIYKD